MNLLQFVPVKLTIFLVTGILIGYNYDVNGWVAISIMATGLLIMYILLVKNKPAGWAFEICVTLVCMGLGVIAVSLHRDFNYSQQIVVTNKKDINLWKLSISEELRSTSYYHRFFAGVSQIDSVKSDGKILCRIPKDAGMDKLSVGDQILVWASATEIEAAGNPYQFNYKKYLKDKGVYLQIKILPENHIKLDKRKKGLRQRGLMLRDELIEHLQHQAFGKDELAVIQAILLGYRNDVDRNLSNYFKAAGAMHIMAISGLHIGIILAILSFILKPLQLLPGGNILKLIISVLVLWCFALLSGFTASIIRAVTMFSFLAYAIFLNRPGSTYNILALSIFFILLALDPLMLFQVGFQLSYAAVLSIVWLYPKLIALWNPEMILIRRIWQLCCVSTSAQFGVLPLTLYYFHQFPALFLISNLIIVPFLGLIIGAGLMIIILAVCDLVPAFFITWYNLLIRSMNTLVEWVANQKALLFTSIYFDKVFLALSACIIISFVAMIQNFNFKRIVSVLGLIICLQFYNSYGLLKSKLDNQMILLHSIGSTSLVYKAGSHLTVFTDHPETAKTAISDLKTGERIQEISFEPLGNSYSFNKQQWIVLDDPVITEESASQADIWLLSNSPKINLDRYLKFCTPEKVIADGSNFKGFVDRWKKSCHQHNVPFYSTEKSGALRLTIQ